MKSVQNKSTLSEESSPQHKEGTISVYVNPTSESTPHTQLMTTSQGENTSILGVTGARDHLLQQLNVLQYIIPHTYIFRRI